jgi:hypothetical protein
MSPHSPKLGIGIIQPSGIRGEPSENRSGQVGQSKLAGEPPALRRDGPNVMSKNTAVLHGDIVLWQDMKSRGKAFIITLFLTTNPPSLQSFTARQVGHELTRIF